MKSFFNLGNFHFGGARLKSPAPKTPADYALSFAKMAGWLFLLALGYLVFRWGFWLADFVAPCDDLGACWAVITSQPRLFFLGTYQAPLDAILMTLCLVVLIALSLIKQFQRPWFFGFLALSLVGIYYWMRHPFSAPSLVGNSYLSGLPLTLFLTLAALLLAFPLGVLLVLGRLSESRLLRAFCMLWVEALRAVPMTAILFIAVFLLPLLLPPSLSLMDKIVPAWLALSLFVAVYVAEILRGSLLSLSKGQSEAAKSLGLSYFQIQRKIILPQVFARAIPALTSIVIGTFKATSLVTVVGLFDFLASAQLTYTSEPKWSAHFIEALTLAALLYLAVNLGIGRYGAHLEKRFARFQR